MRRLVWILLLFRSAHRRDQEVVVSYFVLPLHADGNSNKIKTRRLVRMPETGPHVPTPENKPHPCASSSSSSSSITPTLHQTSSLSPPSTSPPTQQNPLTHTSPPIINTDHDLPLLLLPHNPPSQPNHSPGSRKPPRNHRPSESTTPYPMSERRRGGHLGGWALTPRDGRAQKVPAKRALLGRGGQKC